MNYSLRRSTWTRGGRAGQSGNLRIRFRDHLGRRQDLTGYSSEKRTHALAAKVMALVQARQDAAPLSPEVRKWLTGISPKHRANQAGGDGPDPPGRLPLSVILDGGESVVGWRQALGARGATEHHVRVCRNRAAAVLDGCGFVYYRDLMTAGAQTKVEVWLAARVRVGAFKAGTAAYYVREFKSFCRWGPRRSGSSPTLRCRIWRSRDTPTRTRPNAGRCRSRRWSTS